MSTEHKHVEEDLRRGLKTARDRYENGEGNIEEYCNALRRFADWVLQGATPNAAAEERDAAPLVKKRDAS